MKIKVSNEFEIGFNSLLVNVDDPTGETLQCILKNVKEGDINKLIVYHHSDMPVSCVYKQLVELFASKVFLCFNNYFMYTQTSTP
jgi:catabolite regulation protein CreA